MKAAPCGSTRKRQLWPFRSIRYLTFSWDTDRQWKMGNKILIKRPNTIISNQKEITVMSCVQADKKLRGLNEGQDTRRCIYDMFRKETIYGLVCIKPHRVNFSIKWQKYSSDSGHSLRQRWRTHMVSEKWTTMYCKMFQYSIRCTRSITKLSFFCSQIS